jgi:hypothetical protein
MVFGGGEVGQLGTGMRKDLLVPTKLQAMPSIVQAACGYCHTALLTEAGEVYTCGSAMSGQLGHVRVPHIPFIHSFPRRSRGLFRSTKILYFLPCDEPQADNLQNDRLAPKMVEGLNGKRIRFIACGSFHTIAITGGLSITLDNHCAVLPLAPFSRARHTPDLDNVYTWGGVQGTDSDGAMRQERKAAILKRFTHSPSLRLYFYIYIYIYVLLFIYLYISFVVGHIQSHAFHCEGPNGQANISGLVRTRALCGHHHGRRGTPARLDCIRVMHHLISSSVPHPRARSDWRRAGLRVEQHRVASATTPAPRQRTQQYNPRPTPIIKLIIIIRN